MSHRKTPMENAVISKEIFQWVVDFIHLLWSTVFADRPEANPQTWEFWAHSSPFGDMKFILLFDTSTMGHVFSVFSVRWLWCNIHSISQSNSRNSERARSFVVQKRGPLEPSMSKRSRETWSPRLSGHVTNTIVTEDPWASLSSRPETVSRTQEFCYNPSGSSRYSAWSRSIATKIRLSRKSLVSAKVNLHRYPWR